MGSFAAAILLAALGMSPDATSPTAAPELAAQRSSSAPSPARAPLVPIDPFAHLPTPPRDATRSAAAPPPPAPPTRTSPPEHARATAPRTTTRRPLSADLKDPFAIPGGPRGVPIGPIRDLRDPFQKRPDGLRPGECVTPSGVPVQRPKALRSQAGKCPGHDAPLLNPFAAA